MKHRHYIVFLFVLAVACSLPTMQAQQFSDWNTAVHVAGVNSPTEQTDPFLAKDGLSLYFACNNCPGGYGGYDIWVAHRETLDAAWEPPQNLGAEINTSANETGPMLSVDGHRLYFASTRADGNGDNDLWVSRRHNKRDDLAWRTPENLGPGVNTVYNEAAPTLFEDELTGVTTLFFQSTRPDGKGGADIYASVLQADDSFGPATLVDELSTSADETNPSIARDGLTIFFTSNRPGSMINLQNKPSVDIWMATRLSTTDAWLEPVNVDPDGRFGINTGKHDGGAELSFDGTALYFHAAQRSGNLGVGCPNLPTCMFDIWVATREKLHSE